MFFLILSVIPLSALALGLLRLLPVSVWSAETALRQLLPADTAELFLALLQQADPVAVISVSSLTALWAVSRGTYSLMRGLNRAGDWMEDRSWLRHRLDCLADTLLLLLMLLGGITAAVFLRPVLETIQRLVLQAVSETLLVCAVYRLLPGRRIPFRYILPGAAVTAVVWRMFSVGYGWYLRCFSGTRRLYGNLASAAVTLLWLYFCMVILLTGAILNRILQETNNPQG